MPDCPNECPPGWKYLPTLALPDGSHNFDDDTVYFHLPSLTKPKQTIYGISCFRQIPVEVLSCLCLWKLIWCLFIPGFIKVNHPLFWFQLFHQNSNLTWYFMIHNLHLEYHKKVNSNMNILPCSNPRKQEYKFCSLKLTDINIFWDIEVWD